MTKIQIDLNEEENSILEAYCFVSSEENKKRALKKLIKDFRDLDPKIIKILKFRLKKNDLSK